MCPQNPIPDPENGSFRSYKRSKQHIKVVIIEIGPSLKPYRISKDLITKRSDFFRNMFRNNWAEEQDQKVSLPYIELFAWDIFLAWTKTQKLPVTKWEILEALGYPRHKFPHVGPLHLDPYNIRESVEIYFVKMIELGSFFGADEFVKKLHNCFVDRAMKAQERATYGAVILAFKILPEGHLFLRFLVEAQRHYHDPSREDEEEDNALKQELPVELVSALSSGAVLGIDGSIIYDAMAPLVRSDFHIHVDELERQRCDCIGAVTLARSRTRH